MTKLWRDKTDEEFKNDIMKMVKEGKLFVHNPWDTIHSIEEAKDYVEAIYEEWDQETQAANDCIIEILESYMEFINIMESTLNCYAELPDKIEAMSKTLIAKRRNDWKPILEKVKKAQKSAKKSA